MGPRWLATGARSLFGNQVSSKLNAKNIAQGFPFLLGLFVIIKSYKVLTNIEFWMLDDWAVVEISQNSSINAYTKVFGSLNANLDIYGESSRFTPIGWVITGLKNQLFQDESSYWYSFNLILILFSYVAAFSVVHKIQINFQVNRNIASIVSLVFALYLCLNPGIHDSFDRLGTPESITFTLSIVLLSTLANSILSQHTICYWVISNVVFIGLVGTKENTIFYLPYMFFVGALLWGKSVKRNIVIPLLLSFSFTIWVIGGFLPYLLSSNQDVYGNDRSANGLRNVFFQSLESSYVKPGMVLTIFAIFLILTLHIQKRVKRQLIIGLFMLQIIVVSNFMYFNGNIQANYRIIFYFCFWLLLLSVYTIFLMYVHQRQKNSNIYPKALVGIAIIAMGFIPTYSSEMLIKIKSRADITRSFQDDIDRVAQNLSSVVKKGAKNQVLIYVNNGFDFESVRATIVYLKNKSVQADYFLKFTNKEEFGFPLSLRAELMRFAKEGNQEWNISSNEVFSLDRLPSVINTCVFWERIPGQYEICDKKFYIRWQS